MENVKWFEATTRVVGSTERILVDSLAEVLNPYLLEPKNPIVKNKLYSSSNKYYLETEIPNKLNNFRIRFGFTECNEPTENKNLLYEFKRNS